VNTIGGTEQIPSDARLALLRIFLKDCHRSTSKSKESCVGR
jgi:hypothetical protein